MLAVTELITDGTRVFDATAQSVLYTLLPFAQTPNKEIRAQKLDLSANTVTVQTDPTTVPRDAFPGGVFSIVLTDNSVNYFTVIKKPGAAGVPAIVIAGVGSSGGAPAPMCEAPAGTINGTNGVFTLSFTPILDSLSLSLNGVLQNPGSGSPLEGGDYTISGDSITYLVAPRVGDWHLASYTY